MLGPSLQVDPSAERRVPMSVSLKVDRPVYTEDQILDEFGIADERSKSFSYVFLSWLPNCACSWRRIVDFVYSVVPVLTWFPQYKIKEDLMKDVAAGLTIGIMQIPQGTSTYTCVAS